ncbi:MAG: hypothetical protein HYY99_00385 [Candidatus Colwellbacteria bacterium]|nr:hypothetical protein [Candidatus Colwellbacteria bacterium]
MSKKALAIAVLALGIILTAWLFQASQFGTTALWSLSNEGKWLLPLVVVAALIDSINPCAFSVLLVTIAFLPTIGQIRNRVLRIGGSYILGLFLVYLLIGLGLLQALHLFNTPHFMGKLGAGLLIALGAINIISELFPRFPIKLRIPHAAHRKMAQLAERGSMPTAFALGALVGVCEFPCTGGPYLMVVGLLHDQTTYFKGFGYLLFYNLIFILPLVLILLAASDEKLLSKVQIWQKERRKWMRFGGGIAMILLGALIFLL